MTPAEHTDWIVARARGLGLDLCGVAPADDFAELERLPEWLDRGYAGEMRYLHDPRRRSPRLGGLPGARSVVVCALNYNTPFPYSTDAPREPGHGWISRYAWGDDYHEVLGAKLDALLAAMRAQFTATPFDARAYVDTGPVHERIAAHHAGLGWLGKNTCLINEQLGSWLFLGVILTSLDLAPSIASPAEQAEVSLAHNKEGRSQNSEVRNPTSDLRPQASHLALSPNPLPPDLCGQCTQCLDAYPTGALVEPYVLDARRCISYLTIELRGLIPAEFHDALGWHIFGCDICQDVCPFNRKAPVTSESRFLPRPLEVRSQNSEVGGPTPEIRPPISVAVALPNHSMTRSPDHPIPSPESPVSSPSLFAPPLDRLASLSESDFRTAFRNSAVKRTKHAGLTRNAQIALTNSGV